MATVGVNTKPYTRVQYWETSEDGSIFLQMGQNDNFLQLRTTGDSNITLFSQYKSERTSITINRSCISSAEVNTKTYPIYLIISALIFIYSLTFISYEIDLGTYCSKPIDTRQSELFSDSDCVDYFPFLPQIYGLLGSLLFIIIYIITKRGRIIFRVQSDADFRILIKSTATPSVEQMNRLVNAILFVPNLEQTKKVKINTNMPMISPQFVPINPGILPPPNNQPTVHPQFTQNKQ